MKCGMKCVLEARGLGNGLGQRSFGLLKRSGMSGLIKQLKIKILSNYYSD
jgi:hypothetical protein